MKKIITTVFCTAIALCSGLNVYAAEILERDYIEAEIWEEMWNGKGDNGLDLQKAIIGQLRALLFLIMTIKLLSLRKSSITQSSILVTTLKDLSTLLHTCQ